MRTIDDGGYRAADVPLPHDCLEETSVVDLKRALLRIVRAKSSLSKLRRGKSSFSESILRSRAAGDTEPL